MHNKTAYISRLQAIMLMLTMVLTLAFTTNSQATNHEDEMTTILEELKTLKDNIKDLAIIKKDELSVKFQTAMDRQKRRISELNDSAKEELSNRYDQLHAQYEQAKAATAEKQEEMYNKVVEKLEQLNQDIEDRK